MAIESLLASNPLIVKDVWTWIKGWYQAAIYCALLPYHVIIQWMAEERVYLGPQ